MPFSWGEQFLQYVQAISPNVELYVRFYVLVFYKPFINEMQKFYIFQAT